MARDMCEKCGHAEVYHTDGKVCQLCVQFVETWFPGDTCKEFVPDIFNMWRDDDADDEEGTSDKRN